MKFRIVCIFLCFISISLYGMWQPRLRSVAQINKLSLYLKTISVPLTAHSIALPKCKATYKPVSFCSSKSDDLAPYHVVLKPRGKQLVHLENLIKQNNIAEIETLKDTFSSIDPFHLESLLCHAKLTERDIQHMNDIEVDAWHVYKKLIVEVKEKVNELKAERLKTETFEMVSQRGNWFYADCYVKQELEALSKQFEFDMSGADVLRKKIFTDIQKKGVPMIWDLVPRMNKIEETVKKNIDTDQQKYSPTIFADYLKKHLRQEIINNSSIQAMVQKELQQYTVTRINDRMYYYSKKS